MTAPIGFVCTNFNNSAFTRRAIETLSRDGWWDAIRVVIVDNNSRPDDVEGAVSIPNREHDDRGVGVVSPHGVRSEGLAVQLASQRRASHRDQPGRSRLGPRRFNHELLERARFDEPEHLAKDTGEEARVAASTVADGRQGG